MDAPVLKMGTLEVSFETTKGDVQASSNLGGVGMLMLEATEQQDVKKQRNTKYTVTFLGSTQVEAHFLCLSKYFATLCLMCPHLHSTMLKGTALEEAQHP